MKKNLVILTLVLLTSCADYIDVKIEEKERINKRDESYYLIFTDKGVFKNDDNWFFFKFNSSDIYGKIHVGKCYSLKKRFWRIRIFSMYENIMKAREINCDTTTP